jgi:hypothetical protein
LTKCFLSITFKNIKTLLTILDTLLDQSKDAGLWGASLPIGAESIRIVELIKQLAICIYDFQRLNYLYSDNEEENAALNGAHASAVNNANASKNKTSLHFKIVEFNLQNIG